MMNASRMKMTRSGTVRIRMNFFLILASNGTDRWQSWRGECESSTDGGCHFANLFYFFLTTHEAMQVAG